MNRSVASWHDGGVAESLDAVQALFPWAKRIPPMPPPNQDPILDAAARCFARYGVHRTSVQDVAKEAGVNRTTVYRLIGNIEQVALTLTIREGYRLLLMRAPARLAGPMSPEVIIDILAVAVADAREHPVLSKVLADERELVASLVSEHAEALIGEISEVAAPLLRAAMQAGRIAERDPVHIAQWLVRVVATVILVPPPGELKDFLATVLLPVLTPEK